MTKREWLQRNYPTKERLGRFSTVSDMEIDESTCRTIAARSGADRRARRVSRTRAAPYPTMYRGRSCGRCASSRASAPPQRHQRALQVPARRTGRPASRPPSICRPSWATTPITSARSARSGAKGRRGLDARRHGAALRRHPARRGHDVDDGQLLRDRSSSRCTSRVGREARASRSRELGGTIQNDMLKEFIAQKEWICPPRAVGADRRRHDRVLHEARAALARGLDLRLPHPRGRLDGGAGAGVHARGRDRLRRGGVERGLDVDDFAPRLSFFFDVHNDFFEEIAKFRAARRMWATHHARPVRREEAQRS